MKNKVVIDEVTQRLSEGIAEDCRGSLKKTLGAMKYNHTHLDEVKLRVGALEVGAS